jgi:hypothetical protein
MQVGQVTKGTYRGAIVQPCDTMECPRFTGANGKTVTICAIVLNGEVGLILALNDTEVRWLS